MQKAARKSLTAFRVGLAIFIGLATGPVHAAGDIVWQVENPFRFYRHASSFEIHESAFKAVRGDSAALLPADIIWRMERHLNDPVCGDPSTPASCQASVHDYHRFNESRLGWAARTVNDLCYERLQLPRHVLATCDRGPNRVPENYVLPTSHSIGVWLSPERQREAGDAQCSWRWQPRAGGSWSAPATKPCSDKLVIEHVPYVARDQAASGVIVEVVLPGDISISEPNVVVEDLLIVALGDSFASGEGNPDKPITLSASNQIIYDPSQYDCAGEASLQRRVPAVTMAVPNAERDVLPMRYIPEIERDSGPHPCRASAAFRQLFDRVSAEWLSADCHRSQYGYPIRVALELALEDCHRAITLIPLPCSGSTVTEGLFMSREPRERSGRTKVPAQFAQLTDLICERRGGQMNPVTYALPAPRAGGQRFDSVSVTMNWCPEGHRKRDIDLVLLSIGGNDVGFSGVAAYTFLESVGDIAPILSFFEGELETNPAQAERYLGMLDRRIKAVKDALKTGFGVEPAQVIHTSYEPLQNDENGDLCGLDPALGMDVHPGFQLNRGRLGETKHFVDHLLNRLACISKSTPGCPENLATRSGTGFRLVVDHQVEFMKRGICARDSTDPNGLMMAMLRRLPGGGDWRPYQPNFFTPYSHHTRLFRTPNDAFLTANTHRDGTLVLDTLQQGFAALYSGALHPTAEAHAIVADHVMKHARCIIEKRTTADCQMQ